jgi:hypothetical protein
VVVIMGANIANRTLFTKIFKTNITRKSNKKPQ